MRAHARVCVRARARACVRAGVCARLPTRNAMFELTVHAGASLVVSTVASHCGKHAQFLCKAFIVASWRGVRSWPCVLCCAMVFCRAVLRGVLEQPKKPHRAKASCLARRPNSNGNRQLGTADHVDAERQSSDQ